MLSLLKPGRILQVERQGLFSQIATEDFGTPSTPHIPKTSSRIMAFVERHGHFAPMLKISVVNSRSITNLNL